MSPEIAAISYAAAFVAYLLLAGLLLTRLRRPHGGLLVIACVATAVWSGATAYGALRGNPLSLATTFLELARNFAWYIFLLSLLGIFDKKKESKPSIKFAVSLLTVALVATVYAYTGASASGAAALLIGSGGYTCLAVAGMLLVEQLFRTASQQGRWGIKFACLGIGGMFAFDFYLYSEAMLFRQINADVWSARGIVDALTAPLIAVSAARNSHWKAGVAVSRRLLFNSVALFGAALYLLAMAAVGYYLRYFGGSWGIVAQSAFLFGAVLLLGAVMFSGAFRAHLRVFLSKHFYAYGYDYREEWIRFTRTLAKSGGSQCEQAVKAIGNLVESQGGALWVKRESGDCEPAGYWNMFSSTVVEPGNSSLCRFLEREHWIVDLQEFSEKPENYKDLAIPRWLAEMPKAWLVVPLIIRGKLFGFVVLAQARSPIKLNWEVLDLLKIAGSQAASYLAQNEAANALLVARQFDSYHRMSTFVVHDLKNLVAQLSLLVANAEKHKDSPEFQQDMLETVAYSVDKMKLLLQKFNRSRSSELPVGIALDKLARQVVEFKASLRPSPTLRITHPGLMVFGNFARLERVISHFVLNAIEATPRDGKVTLSVERHGNRAVIICEDTGQGMTDEFIRERLFKPFESTKSTGMGIGVFEAREYIYELGGRIEVNSRVSEGTTFRISLPLYENDEQTVPAVESGRGRASEPAEKETSLY